MSAHVRAVLAVVFCLAWMLIGSAIALAAAPTIASISPNNGPAAGGTSVTITGTGFPERVSMMSQPVKFGISPASSVTGESSTRIKATSPPGSGLVNVSVTNSSGETSAPTPYDQFGYDPTPSGLWLGLDGNSSEIGSEHIAEFTTHNVVYDRGGGERGLNWIAGELLEEVGKLTVRGEALEKSIEAGMIPDIIINYAGYLGNFKSDPNFPTTTAQIEAYTKGFVASALAIVKKYPGRQIIFEPINEPWGYTTPQHNGAEYANVIAKLLPEVKAAGIPQNLIYVAGQGKDCANPGNPAECTSNGWVPAMYAADPKLREEIQGWYAHPYGPPSGLTEDDNGGIEAVPHIQEKMTSGQNNIIVSEVGFCALDVYQEVPCNGNPEVANSTLAAQDLTETLAQAKPYHEAGWLRALIVYDRKGSGFSMQQETGTWPLTKQGEAFDTFAESLVGWAVESTPSLERAVGRLYGVSCVFSTACAGVGYYKSNNLIEHWNGAEWSMQPILSPSGAEESILRGVSCSSMAACTAVGYYKNSSGTEVTLAEYWNGTEWTLQSTSNPSGATASELLGVSCSSSTACVATGRDRNSSGTEVTLAERWNGTEWTLQSTSNPSGATASELLGVSCTSSTACVATGRDRNSSGTEVTLAERWNGTEWTLQSTPNPSGATESELRGVSCTSSTACIAIGRYVNSLGTKVSLAERWSGTEWLVQSTPNPAGAKMSELLGVSCSSSMACSAVGYSEIGGPMASIVTLAERWNGTEWALQSTPNPTGSESQLYGVSCKSPTACVGVGYHYNTVTLAEANF
jgi:hypothetical protein